MARCLIVDDSEAMREIANEHLTALGHEVVEAGDAETALSALICAPSDGASIDLVLLDWDLPGLGALDVLRAAADLAARPEIVLCATEHDPRQLQLAAAAGARHHVLKPFDADAIRQVVAEALGPAAPEAAA